MKTLSNHVLIYDKDCPMCDLYTKAFIKSKMLDETGRVSFTAFNSDNLSQWDCARAKDEIALVNTETGAVTYGVESLFRIIVNRFTILRLLFDQSHFKKLISILYKFISFNRKIIAPAPIFEEEGSCTPSYNLKYRWAYIILSWIFTSTILTIYAAKLTPLIPATSFSREWLICGGQIIWQSLFVSLIKKDRIVHYLGNMMTVSNIGALLLTPLHFVPIDSPILFSFLFSAVVLFMLIEHYRRAKILELGIWISISWVGYRLFVLATIYFL